MTSFPLEMPFDSPGYATYISGRKPVFKAHAHRGLAKSALKSRLGHLIWNDRHSPVVFQAMAMYKLCQGDDGKMRWILDTEITEGSKPSDYPELWPKG